MVRTLEPTLLMNHNKLWSNVIADRIWKEIDGGWSEVREKEVENNKGR